MFPINSKNWAIKCIYVALRALNASIQPPLRLSPSTKPSVKEKDSNEKCEYERIIRWLNVRQCKRYIEQHTSLKS